MELETIRAVFGWCAVLNLGFLFFAGTLVLLAGGPIKTLHGKFYGLPAEDLDRAYFQYLAQYKIATFVFSLVPWVALCLVA